LFSGTKIIGHFEPIILTQKLDYFGDNIVFFHTLDYHTYASLFSQLYFYVYFTASIGGALGLCMGFSLISAVEIVYFFTVRVFFQKEKKKPGPAQHE
jgi:hypothetical protein